MLDLSMAFATPDDYMYGFGGRKILPAELPQKLLKASDDVNTLTFGRARARWDTLTDFQKATIKRVTCMQADFCEDNADIISNVLTSYSINGVSMSFDVSKAWNVYADDGVIMEQSTYRLLSQTGLTCRRI